MFRAWQGIALALWLAQGAFGCIDFDAARKEFCRDNARCSEQMVPVEPPESLEPVEPPFVPGNPDIGPPGRGLTAAGGKAASSKWTIVSATGQSTPVGNGAKAAPGSGLTIRPGIYGRY